MSQEKNKRRITKVTTRAGDAGNTKLATGRTIGKHEPVVRVMGSIDELNSHIGVLEALVEDQTQQNLRAIQQALFDMGAVFAMEGSYDAPEHANLEAWTDTLNSALPPLTEFVLPRGGTAAAQSHVCRAVCRRAESELWGFIAGLDDPAESFGNAARYLNRLSDYFFVLARALSQGEEQQWQGPER